MIDAVTKLLIGDEGFKGRPYPDTDGNVTILFGRNLSANPFTREEGLLLLRLGINKRKAQIKNWQAYRLANTARRAVLINMAYNNGVEGLRRYKKMLAAMRREDYLEAAAQLMDSNAARKLPARYKRLERIMLTGVME